MLGLELSLMTARLGAARGAEGDLLPLLLPSALSLLLLCLGGCCCCFALRRVRRRVRARAAPSRAPWRVSRAPPRGLREAPETHGSLASSSTGLHKAAEDPPVDSEANVTYVL